MSKEQEARKRASNNTLVLMDRIPVCDIVPEHGDAYADAKTTQGSWGYLCRDCFDHMGVGLGLGRGQRLELRDPECSVCGESGDDQELGPLHNFGTDEAPDWQHKPGCGGEEGWTMGMSG